MTYLIVKSPPCKRAWHTIVVTRTCTHLTDRLGPSAEGPSRSPPQSCAAPPVRVQTEGDLAGDRSNWQHCTNGLSPWARQAVRRDQRSSGHAPCPYSTASSAPWPHSLILPLLRP